MTMFMGNVRNTGLSETLGVKIGAKKGSLSCVQMGLGKKTDRLELAG